MTALNIIASYAAPPFGAVEWLAKSSVGILALATSPPFPDCFLRVRLSPVTPSHPNDFNRLAGDGVTACDGVTS